MGKEQSNGELKKFGNEEQKFSLIETAKQAGLLIDLYGSELYKSSELKDALLEAYFNRPTIDYDLHPAINPRFSRRFFLQNGEVTFRRGKFIWESYYAQTPNGTQLSLEKR